MCGIAGLLAPEQSTEDIEAAAREMISVMRHRGPDDGAIWRSESVNLVLGHRRLAIQDLSDSGSQPMLSASKRYCVVYNGEIYNFREIAAELKHRYQFTGHSDTEVLLAAIEEWGLLAALKRFVGMFAFALWDRDTKNLHLCRDRLGEKPLYYGWLGGNFYFASELKAIEKAVSKAELEIDHIGLADYLKNGYIQAPASIYKNIAKLVPGSVLTLPLSDVAAARQYSPVADSAALSPQTYWSIRDTANHGLSHPIQSEDEAITQLDDVLRQSVRRQLIADVKVGTFLSGGIDSSVVSAIAQHESSERVRTYTIGFSEKEYDESVYAEKIAQHLGTDHLTMRVTPGDALSVVPDLATIYDEPFADSSQIPSFLVSRLAKEHVTVCLSGDGGDELFAGYNRYLWTRSLWDKLSHLPYGFRRLSGAALSRPSPSFWDTAYRILSCHKSGTQTKQRLVGLKIQKLAGFMQQKDVTQAYDYLMSYWSPQALVNEDITAYTGRSALQPVSADDFIDQAMYMDQSIYLPGDNLTKVDRASMAVSLETRLPLLSHDVVDLAWQIPLSMKVKNNVSKWALRKVLYKYVPPKLIDRPKMGFSVPVTDWLRGDLNVWAQDLLATVDNGGILNKNLIDKVWKEHASGKFDHSHRLWTVLMFLSWSQNRA